MLGISITCWIDMARIVRQQVKSLKEQEFTMAAFVLGASSSRILLKHLLINTMGQIIVTVTLMVPQAIFTEAWLSFLGVGISAPMASWGCKRIDYDISNADRLSNDSNLYYNFLFQLCR